MRSGRFNPDEDARIEAMCESGATTAEIAAALDRCYGSTASRCVKLCVSPRTERTALSTVVQSTIRTLTEDVGLPAAIIAAVVNRKKHVVGRVRARRGYRLPAFPCRLSFSVTRHAHDKLSDAGRRHGLEICTVARSIIECAARGRADVLSVIVAPSPSPARGAPISTLLSPMLEGRI
jgi:hypothetical protein